MKVKPDDETGKGKRKGDRRYRNGVRDSIEGTDASEQRVKQDRDLSRKDFKEASDAEDDARSPARK